MTKIILWKARFPYQHVIANFQSLTADEKASQNQNLAKKLSIMLKNAGG